jgi:hypothetical protein
MANWGLALAKGLGMAINTENTNYAEQLKENRVVAKARYEKQIEADDAAYQASSKLHARLKNAEGNPSMQSRIYHTDQAIRDGMTGDALNDSITARMKAQGGNNLPLSSLSVPVKPKNSPEGWTEYMAKIKQGPINSIMGKGIDSLFGKDEAPSPTAVTEEGLASVEGLSNVMVKEGDSEDLTFGLTRFAMVGVDSDGKSAEVSATTGSDGGTYYYDDTTEKMERVPTKYLKKSEVVEHKLTDSKTYYDSDDNPIDTYLHPTMGRVTMNTGGNPVALAAGMSDKETGDISGTRTIFENQETGEVTVAIELSTGGTVDLDGKSIQLDKNWVGTTKYSFDPNKSDGDELVIPKNYPIALKWLRVKEHAEATNAPDQLALAEKNLEMLVANGSLKMVEVTDPNNPNLTITKFVNITRFGKQPSGESTEGGSGLEIGRDVDGDYVVGRKVAANKALTVNQINELKEQVAASQLVMGHITNITKLITEDPTTVGYQGMVRRFTDSMLSHIGGSTETTDPQKVRSLSEIIKATVWKDFVGSGQLSVTDNKTLDRVISTLDSTASPQEVVGALEDLGAWVNSKMAIRQEALDQQEAIAHSLQQGAKTSAPADGNNWLQALGLTDGMGNEIK